ncbi:MAG: glycosyltransferase family 4 protein [Flavobacteriales bacterium]|nr:glycosyltransferase family 4 protein [Flavobacteriales bacterium]
MRIAVTTRLLLPGRLEGIGWFTHETLQRMVRAHPEHRFLFLFDRRPEPRFIYASNVKAVAVPPPTRHPLLYRIWAEMQLPRALRRHKADVLLSPDGILSLRARLPQVAVIHDLNFEHHPEDLPRAYRNYYRTHFPRFAKKAERIITVSEFSKQDIIARYQVPADRIDVVHNGVGVVFRPSTPEERAKARRDHGQGADYLVCVGSLHPRKNIARLLTAFDHFASDRPGIRLVIVGDAFWWDDRMKAAWSAMRHKDRVSFTGRLDQVELRDVIAGALALVYVSYFEGFGIPVVEAMRCGVPVIAANTTSLPEVAGEAALYCDPFNTEDITRAMTELASSDTLRTRLGHAGTERAVRYDWDRTAEGVWSSLQKVFEAHGPKDPA